MKSDFVEQANELKALAHDGTEVDLDGGDWNFRVSPPVKRQFQNHLLGVLVFGAILELVFLFGEPYDEAKLSRILTVILFLSPVALAFVCLPFVMNSRAIEVNARGISVDRYLLGKISVSWDQVTGADFRGLPDRTRIILFTEGTRLPTVAIRFSTIPFDEKLALARLIYAIIYKDREDSDEEVE
jgi:hypothetical protein